MLRNWLFSPWNNQSSQTFSIPRASPNPSQKKLKKRFYYLFLKPFKIFENIKERSSSGRRTRGVVLQSNRSSRTSWSRLVGTHVDKVEQLIIHIHRCYTSLCIELNHCVSETFKNRKRVFNLEAHYSSTNCIASIYVGQTYVTLPGLFKS
jgi:hypothetical protein